MQAINITQDYIVSADLCELPGIPSAVQAHPAHAAHTHERPNMHFQPGVPNM